ncbi:MAG: hypothetical protein MUQ00_11295 [Candidatus Aminicenantes bacterium]|nr:hypothetical protein [Candidatus Aminicenantes bacterium]
MISNAASRIGGFVRLTLPVMAIVLLLFPLGSLAAGQTTLTAEDFILKTLEAAGGQNAVSAVRTLSFKIGPQNYIAAADGRLKVKAALEAAVVYEAILVAGGTVRRNTLNRTSVVAGAEAVRGFSTHQPAKTLPEAIVSDHFDVVLMTYNHMESASVEPLIAQARAKGIGTIAMKVFAGGKQGNLKSLIATRLKYSQAALRWVLGNPASDGLIITMSTFTQVEEYVSAAPCITKTTGWRGMPSAFMPGLRKDGSRSPAKPATAHARRPARTASRSGPASFALTPCSVPDGDLSAPTLS